MGNDEEFFRNLFIYLKGKFPYKLSALENRQKNIQLSIYHETIVALEQVHEVLRQVEKGIAPTREDYEKAVKDGNHDQQQEIRSFYQKLFLVSSSPELAIAFDDFLDHYYWDSIIQRYKLFIQQNQDPYAEFNELRVWDSQKFQEDKLFKFIEKYQLSLLKEDTLPKIIQDDIIEQNQQYETLIQDYDELTRRNVKIGVSLFDVAISSFLRIEDDGSFSIGDLFEVFKRLENFLRKNDAILMQINHIHMVTGGRCIVSYLLVYKATVYKSPKDLVEAFDITVKIVQDFFLSLSNSEIYVQVDEAPDSSTYDQEKFDWDVFFEDYTDSNRSVDFDSAFNDFQKLENKHWIKRAFYVQLFQKINPSQAISLINWWFDNPRNGMYDLDDLLKAIPSRFKRRMSFLAVLDSRIKQFLKAHHADFYIDTYGSNLKLHILSELTGKPKTDYIQFLLEGMSESSITLESESLFRIAHLLTPMIAPNQSCEVLEYGLGLLESDLGSDIADGQWREELAPPENLIESISGYIWSGLASPFNTVKWQAAHTVKLLCDFKQRELLSNLINFISDKNYQSFYDHKFEFYQYSATQWLLNVFLKVSYSPNNFLAEYVQTFKQLADPKRPHLMLRFLASKILLNLFRLKLINLNEEEITIYQGVGKSNFDTVQQEGVDLSSYSDINQDEIDSFGIDFGPYWLEPLGSIFGLNPTHIYFETTQTLKNEIGFTDKRKANDARHKMEVYDWEQTSHSHGSSPKVEDLDFYLSYHAMMITADKLLQTKPLLESEYSWGEFDDWIKRHDLSSLEPYWLSDFRDTCPRITTEWPKEDRKDPLNWSYSCSPIDYDDAIYHSDLEFCLWGVWSEVHNDNQAKDIRIRSSLVNPKTSDALWRSLQSADSSYSYHLPNANNEQFEIDEDNFQLKGWITETEIDLSNFDHDLWGASLRYEITQPSLEIVSLMNLSSDSLEKNWFHENEKVINLALWGQYKNENFEYSNGYKLKVNKKFILELLDKIDMDMIISVDIDRRYKYGSYQSKEDSKGLDKYLPSSKRVYLMKKNGDMYVY